MNRLLGLAALSVLSLTAGSADAFFNICCDWNCKFNFCCPRIVFGIDWGCPAPCPPPCYPPVHHAPMAWYDQFPPLPAFHGHSGSHAYTPSPAPTQLHSPTPVQGGTDYYQPQYYGQPSYDASGFAAGMPNYWHRR